MAIANKGSSDDSEQGATDSLQQPSTKLLAQLMGLQFVEKLDDPDPPRDLARGDFDRIIGSWGRQHLTVPIGGDEEHVIIATSDPFNLSAIDQLRLCYNRPYSVVVTSEEQIEQAINNVRTKLMSNRSSELSEDEDSESADDLDAQLKIDVTDAEDDDAPIIRYVNAIIFKASRERASDVHIEPFEGAVKVRFRIDGVLQDKATESKAFHAGIVSRIKVMAGLNIAEKRLPQDGRIGIKIAGKDVDIRVSTVPTQFGERIVMRLLDKSSVLIELEQLGLLPELQDTMHRLIRKPNGIVLVTGPTGSGKTTTLYACLSKINTPELNILTIEDPVEYQLEGVGQMQVNPKIDFTFASGLRSILRQDPDVVMVGEIRDIETAEIAVQASLTGHLVLSTLHTNDAAGAVSRLIDMGVEPFLVASSLAGVMGQRLVRRVCKVCRQPYEISDEELYELGLESSEITTRTVYRAHNSPNCPECHGAGYTGRMGIHELLLIEDSIRSLILQRADSSSLKNFAKENMGFRTLRENGALKVLAGETTVEEVLRVATEDVV